MKHARFFIFVIFILTVILLKNDIYAEELEKFYIVQLENDVSLFEAYDFVGDCEIVVMNEEELAECLEEGVVCWYEEDFEVELFDEAATDEEVYDKWDLKMIEADIVANAGCSGSGVRIGIIDSGIVSHQDLGDNILSGYNYLEKSTDVTDNIGHGTFVSGLIGAKVNGIGIDGVAPDAEIVPFKCFDRGYTTRVSHICSALYDAADNYECDIINMSLGVSSYSKTFETAINYVLDKGIIVVAAVGNTGEESLYYPAAFEEVIGVAAVDSEGERSLFSQKNESVTITAPGEYIYSTDMSGGYSTKKGTSFSTPLVSGCIAAFMNIDEELDVKKLLELFQACSEDKGDAGYDTEYGYGIISCKNIVKYMLQDIKCFVAPLKVGLADTAVVAYNNTDTVIEGIVCIGQYDERGVMKACDIIKMKVEPYKSAELKTFIKDENIRCFVWEDIVNVNILSNVRERAGS